MLRALASLRKCIKRFRRLDSLILAVLALLLGFLVYWKVLFPDDPIDALYLTIVTISTVGYGDIGPSQYCFDDEGSFSYGSANADSVECVGMRVFTIFYILIGVVFVFSQLSNIFAGALEAFSNFIKRQIDRLDTTAAAVDTTGDGKADTKVSGRTVGLSGKGRDITGDGVTDFIEPPTAVVYWTQELVPALVLVTIWQVVSAAIFTVCIPELDFGTAFYHCMITATTVGYGDVQIAESKDAKLFACLHIVVSVSWIASLISWIDNLSSKRSSQLQRANLILNPPKREQIMALDHDNKGVDELEFVVGMLMNLGVQLCGQKLTWDDVRPFKLQFQMFDVSKTGRLSKDDLEAYARKMELVNMHRNAASRAEALESHSGRDTGSLSFGKTSWLKTSELFMPSKSHSYSSAQAPELSLAGQIAQQDKAVAHMQAVIRGWKVRKSLSRIAPEEQCSDLGEGAASHG